MHTAYFNAERLELLDFLRPHGNHAHSIDIGCGAGRFGQQLLAAGLSQRCDAVEPHAPAAQQARERLHQVWNLPLEAALDVVAWPQYDLVIMADVLEHLLDPWQVLAQLQQRVRHGTKLLLSVPNVRHKSVVFPLLLHGRFDYAAAGIMDRTHLHFFTRSSICAAVQQAGWRILDIAPFLKRKYRRCWFPQWLLADFFAVQYFLIAAK